MGTTGTTGTVGKTLSFIPHLHFDKFYFSLKFNNNRIFTVFGKGKITKSKFYQLGKNILNNWLLLAVILANCICIKSFNKYFEIINSKVPILSTLKMHNLFINWLSSVV